MALMLGLCCVPRRIQRDIIFLRLLFSALRRTPCEHRQNRSDRDFRSLISMSTPNREIGQSVLHLDLVLSAINRRSDRPSHTRSPTLLRIDPSAFLRNDVMCCSIGTRAARWPTKPLGQTVVGGRRLLERPIALSLRSGKQYT